MKTQINLKTGMARTAVLAAVIFASAIPVIATTHVIQFGGSLGFVYSPGFLNVAVGDTIKWQGDFGTHPLSSTSVPPGAASFHHASGSAFTYPVAATGTYQYRCDNHFGLGMTGSFTAATTGVGEKWIFIQPNAARLEQNYPNPFNAHTVIRFDLPVSQRVLLKVYSVLGKEMEILVDGVMPAGGFAVPFDASALVSGVYYYMLVTDRYTETKRLVLLK